MKLRMSRIDLVQRVDVAVEASTGLGRLLGQQLGQVVERQRDA
jgi:hypothetical protein